MLQIAELFLPKSQLDELDVSIVRLLMKDGRQTNVALAEQLGTSPGTIRNRIVRLLENEVMQVVAVAEPAAIGFHVNVYMGLEVEHGKIQDVAIAFAGMEPVRYVAFTSGIYDLIVLCIFRSTGDQATFLRDQVGKLDGIRRVQTTHILKTVKRNYDFFRGGAT